MMVINQSNHYGSVEDSIWSEKLSDGSHPFLYITPDNPAKLIWSDDNGYVFIRFNCDDSTIFNTYWIHNCTVNVLLSCSLWKRKKWKQ